MKYSVIIIDDSTLVREMLKAMINQIEGFEVVETAVDAYDAREKIKIYEPDLVTIDINMPKMDGVSFLKNLMRLHPMPAFIVSSDASKHQEVFDDGAMGFIKKRDSGEDNNAFFARLQDTLQKFTFIYDRYQLTKPKPQKVVDSIQSDKEVKLHPDVLLPKKPAFKAPKKLIALGSSAGGIEALLIIFSQLPAGLPPIVISQHIPQGFSSNFAKRLNNASAVNVRELTDETILEDGCAYLAQGGKHLIVLRDENTRAYVARVIDGPRISRHKPSVDVMFRSVNNLFGSSALGVILTGMGDDGAIGLKELFDNGASTIAQDEKTSFVYGMPKKAVEAGAVREILSLDDIPQRIVRYAQTGY